MTDSSPPPIGPYRLLAPLGSSSLGDLFRGQDTRDGSAVALTVVRDELAGDARWRTRLLEAVDKLQGLPTPSPIQAVREAGEAGGRYYIAAMPYDRTLREQAAAWASEPAERSFALALALGAQAAQALDVAHQRGLVHGHLRPERLLISDGRTGPALALGEFGLATLAPDDSAAAVAYRSPEQCAGGAAEPASDVYALGVILYELLGGFLPFPGDSAADIMRQQRESDPLPPMLPGLPNDFEVETLIMRCLAKKPAQRPIAAELAAALTALLGVAVEEESAPVQSGLPSTLPALPPPPAPARSFQIETLDAAGSRVDLRPLGGDGLIVGLAANGETVAFDSADAVESVAQIYLEWGRSRRRVTVSVHDPRRGLRLGGAALPPGEPQSWDAESLLQVGAFWLRLIEPAVVTAPPSISTPAPAATASTPEVAVETPPAAAPAPMNEQLATGSDAALASDHAQTAGGLPSTPAPTSPTAAQAAAATASAATAARARGGPSSTAASAPPSSSATTPPTSASTTAGAPQRPVPPRVTLRVEPEHELRLNPDKPPVLLRVTLKNIGRNNEKMLLRVVRNPTGVWVPKTRSNIAQGWVDSEKGQTTLGPNSISLSPGDERVIQLPIVITKRPENQAGTYGVLITAVRAVQQGEQGEQGEQGGQSGGELLCDPVAMLWHVEPYLNTFMFADPKTSSGYFPRSYAVIIENNSNTTVDYSLALSDQSDELRFDPPLDRLVLSAGEHGEAQIRSRRNSLAFQFLQPLRDRRHTIMAEVRPRMIDFPSDAARGDHGVLRDTVTYIHNSLLPAWLLALLSALLVLLAFWLYQLPQIVSASLQPPGIMIGGPFGIRVQAENASRVEVRLPNQAPIPVAVPTQGGVGVASVTLPTDIPPPDVAKVRAYGIFGLFWRDKQVPLVIVTPEPPVPPTPTATSTASPTPCIMPTLAPKLAADPPSIDSGGSSTLAWPRAENATQITIYKIGPDDEPVFLFDASALKEGGRLDVRPEFSTEYQLEAKNCGTTVSSFVTVDVIPFIPTDLPREPDPTTPPTSTPTATPKPPPVYKLSCPLDTRITLTGDGGGPNEPYLLRFGPRVPDGETASSSSPFNAPREIGGGSTEANGSFEITMVVQRERKGTYPLQALLRASERPLMIRNYRLNDGPTIGLSPSESTQLVCIVPEPPARATPTPVRRP